MPHNLFKPKGQSKATKPDAGGAVAKTFPVFGVVKDNIDPIRSGRLKVYLTDAGGNDPSNADSWVTVNYMSPFYGMTEGNAPKDGYGTYLQNPSSYGMWYSPPDIGTTVICIFINGDMNYGFWIGAVPEPEALFMIPAIGSTETVVTNEGEANSYGGATKLPVTNINTNNPTIDNSSKFYDEPKPVHSYLAGVLNQQGLLRDTIRGTIGTSSQRETPSRVGWGVNSPGRPIYEGGYTDETIADAAKDKKNAGSLKVISRRVGHSIVMDDGDLLGRDQLIRLRSALGHQILLSDDGQCLHIIHANGQSWIELGKEGTIDMYATNSVNIRTQGDLNLHADNNVNINAAKDMNFNAKNISFESEETTSMLTGTNFSAYTQGKHTLKVDSQLAMKSSGEASLYSDNITYINGSKVNLNTGSPSITPQVVKPITKILHTDTLYDKTKGWAAAPGKLPSIVSRAPAHAPWASAGQGVDVKINNDAEANFPAAPNPAVQAANANVPAPQNPVSPSVASTVPLAGAVSGALDKNATSALVGQIATTAGSNPDIAAAIKNGAGIVTQAGEKIAVVGKTAQSLQQVESSGTLKAGAAALATSLIQQGKTLTQALPPSLFTGQPGAENLTALKTNLNAQVNNTVTNLQQAQTTATQAGLITGKESAGQVAGIVNSTAMAGLGATVAAVKNIAGNLSNTLTAPFTNLGTAANKLLGSNPLSSISSGAFAGNFAGQITGGLGSIAGSLNGLAKSIGGKVTSLLDSAKGVAGSAFAAITKAFPKLEAGKPQNLKKIADEAVANAQNAGTELQAGIASGTTALNNAGAGAAALASGAASGALNSVTGAAQSIAGGAAGALNGALGSVTGAVNGALGQVTGTLSAKIPLQIPTNAAGSLLPASVSTGLGALPGAEKTVATVVNNATGMVNNVPGVSAISGAINQVKSAITGKLSGLTGAAGGLLDKLKNPGASLAALASTGLPAGAAAQLNAAISSISSGGALPIKLPTVAVNTNDRTSLDKQIASVFGSTKIPLPNFSGNPASVGSTAGTAAIEAANKKNDEVAELTKKLEKNTQDIKTVAAELRKAEGNLPSGDPGIIELKNKYSTLIEEKTALLEEVAKVLA